MKNFIPIFIILLFTSVLYSGTENQSGLLSPTKVIQNTISERSQPIRVPSRDDRVMVDVFSEDFENDAEGWQTMDLINLDTAWHKSDFLNPEDDNLLWWCGDSLTEFDEDYVGYNNSWLQYLDTPVLDFADAEDGLSLTFDAYWLVEDPRRVAPPDPYDGWDGFVVMISTDGGEEFSAINPDSPEYDAERLSAAERWWDLGPTPAWTFMSGEWDDVDDVTPEPQWVDVVFDLSDYAAEEDVVIRFLLASDRTVSAPFNPYLANSGIFLDNIVIEDNDENVFLFNNADDDPVPSDLIPRRGEGFGDWWELTDTNRPDGEGENSMWLEDGHVSLFNALQSPPFEIPEGMNVFFQYWVWCDIPDSDGNGDNQLEDYYEVYLSDDDGESWSRQHYDYNRDGVGGDGWAHYVPGSPFGNVNIDMDLSTWAGEVVMLRWVARSDHNEDGGSGEGLFIDDIEVVADDRWARDAGMENFVVPYPLTVAYRVGGATVEMYNYGTRDLVGVNAGWGWTDPNGDNYIPIVPRPNIGVDSFENINLTDYRRQQPGWAPTVPGEYTIWAASRLGAETTGDQSDDDQAPENDRVQYESVRVNPEDIFELGYDNRSYQFLENFDANTGAATRYSPGDIELDQYTLSAVKIQFNGLQNSADYRLHILGAGDDDNTPGAELIARDVTVTVQESIPNWHTVLLYEHEELRDLEGDFWVWIEVLGDDGIPQIVWDTQTADDGRFFSFDGQNADGYQGDLMMHAVVVPEPIEVPTLTESEDFLDFDEVFLGESVTRQVRLYSTAFAPVTISNVSVESDVFSLEFPEEVTLDFGEYYAVDVVFTPTNYEGQEAALTIETDAEEAPQIDLWGSGTDSAPEDGMILPFKFELSEAYPNPFNSMTRINFSLQTHGMAKVSLFDINGRFVSALAGGNFTAGSHQIAVNAEMLSSGVYLVMLESNQNTAIRKIVLMK